MNGHITYSTNPYRALSLLLPAAVCYEIFGPFPMTSQGSRMFEMTPSGALITFNGWYVVGYPDATY